MCLEFQALSLEDFWRWVAEMALMTVIQYHREMVKPVDFILLCILILNCNIELIFIVNN